MTEQDASSGSLVADHETHEAPVPVSPTTNESWRSGTLRHTFKPVACWRIHHAFFRFDSSVVLPELAAELTKLRAIVNESRLATIFGHADPVGDAEYNAHLSGRRARALFALLTRNVDIWLELYKPNDYDEWGLISTQTMLGHLKNGAGSPYYRGTLDGVRGSLTDSAIRTFQKDVGINVDGDAGPVTRRKLYERYMDALTGQTAAPLMRPEQFLGDPADNAAPTGKAKAALQGCSEHNPIIVFSSADESRFAKQANKAERNARNAPNRRVMVFFFAKAALGSLTPAKLLEQWPCPAWDEGSSGCKKQFWKDSDTRLAPAESERNFADGARTMACSWYDRYARLSPCEGWAKQPALDIRLVDLTGNVIPQARCKIVDGAYPTPSTQVDGDCLVADDSGIVQIIGSGMARTATIEWGPPTSDANALPFTRLIYLRLSDGDEGLYQRLGNLGFDGAGERADHTRQFQATFGQQMTGAIGDISRDLIAWHDLGELPAASNSEPLTGTEPVESTGPADGEDLSDGPGVMV